MKRSDIVALRASLHPGEAISEVQWLDLIGILDTIAEGYDVRQNFGIEPKAGVPPAMRGMHKWIVLHFLALCADDPDEPEKVHRGTVAKSWGTTDGQVEKLVRKYRAYAEPLLTTMSIEAILESARILQPEYKRTKKKRSTRNPR